MATFRRLARGATGLLLLGAICFTGPRIAPAWAQSSTLAISGGTWVDRDPGLIGTGFVFNPDVAGGTVDEVEISGPAGWNGGNPFTCGRFQPPGIAPNRAMCWDAILPVTGRYTARATVAGQDLETNVLIVVNSQLTPPEITKLEVAEDRVTFEWSAPPTAHSFLVRVNPDPFTGVTGEMVVSSGTRRATLTGLALEPGARYQAVVWGFSHDVQTPSSLIGLFNLASDDVFFTAPIGQFSNCDELPPGIPLSPIAQAVQAVVNEPFYCLNSFDELIILPDPLLGSGKPAFEKFADLARTAQFEVNFVNMIWMDERVTRDDAVRRKKGVDNGPMVTFLQGIRDLYEKVRADPASYPQGMRVRILTGFQYSALSDPIIKDQRVSILRALRRLGVPREDGDWHVEIGAYRKSSTTDFIPRMGTHSHVKMLIVDGRSAIVAGYNMEYEYLSRRDSPSAGALKPKHDFGVAVSGPIVQSSLDIFRELWRDARVCTAFVEIFCIREDTASSIGSSPLQIPVVGGTPVSVFSLFRNDEPGRKDSDRAIVAAIEAARSSINIVQARYFENVLIGVPFSSSCLLDIPPVLCDDSGPMDYTLAVITALKKGVKVRLLLPIAKPEDVSYNRAGAGNLVLQAWLRGADLSNLEIGFFGSRGNRPPIHGKAVSIDGQFLIVGSQNWDHSAFGDLENVAPGSFDLAEYNLGIDSAVAAGEFNHHFETIWANQTPFWPPSFRPGD